MIIHQLIRRRIFFIAGLLLCLTAPANAQDISALRARLQVYLDSIHAAGRFPGATVAVVMPDNTTLELATGVADRTTAAKMRADARMLAGSVGKTFFAALALEVVQSGKLDLDAPISRYLGNEPWFARVPNANAITVRMLMNHTSGLVRYEFNPRVTEKLTHEPDHVWSPAERVSYILDTTAPFAAGAGWDYSDTNYIVLGMILEKITGRDLYTQVEERFLKPLKLSRTVPSDRREARGVVQGYAGPQNSFGGRDEYGLGVIIRETPVVGTMYGHSGFFPGYLTEMRYYPQHKFAVAAQFNSSAQGAIGRAPGAIVQDIARIVLSYLSGN